MMTEVQMNEAPPQTLGHSSDGSAEGEDGLRRRGGGSGAASDEDDSGAVQQLPLEPEERKWASYLLMSCVADFFGSAVIIITSFKYAYRDNGVSLWCLGLQSIAHWLSSLLLGFRLYNELAAFRDEERSGGSSDALLLRERRRKVLHREQAFSVTMGLVMLVSCAALLFKAMRKIKFWNRWYLDHQDMDREVELATDWLAWVGFSIYTLQAMLRLAAVCKLRLSYVTNSLVVSVVSLCFLFVLGLAASYEREWSWKAEPIAAMVLSMVMLVEGIRVIINHFDDMDDRLQYDNRA